MSPAAEAAKAAAKAAGPSASALVRQALREFGPQTTAQLLARLPVRRAAVTTRRRRDIWARPKATLTWTCGRVAGVVGRWGGRGTLQGAGGAAATVEGTLSATYVKYKVLRELDRVRAVEKVRQPTPAGRSQWLWTLRSPPSAPPPTAYTLPPQTRAGAEPEPEDGAASWASGS